MSLLRERASPATNTQRTGPSSSAQRSEMSSDTTMSRKKAWMEAVKSEVEKRPVVSHAIVASILVLIEKYFVEVEFQCPCKAHLNFHSAAQYFVVPAVVAFVLTSVPGSWKSPGECLRNVLCGAAYALLWLVLLFLDGNYFVCAMTTWSGKYVDVPEAAPWKWCEPDSENSSEELNMSKDWFSQSQVFGLWIIMFLAIVVAAYACFPGAEEGKRQGGQGKGHSSDLDGDEED